MGRAVGTTVHNLSEITKNVANVRCMLVRVSVILYVFNENVIDPVPEQTKSHNLCLSLYLSISLFLSL